MKKQSFTILLVLLINMISTKAFAYDIAVQNADGVTIYYNYINDGNELEVTNSKYLGNVVIPEEVTYMSRTLKVTRVGDYAFDYCTNLTSVTILATTPPTGVSQYTFMSTPDAIVYVPSGSVDTYKAAGGWSQYASRIQAIPT